MKLFNPPKGSFSLLSFGLFNFVFFLPAFLALSFGIPKNVQKINIFYEIFSRETLSVFLMTLQQSFLSSLGSLGFGIFFYFVFLESSSSFSRKNS